MTLRDTDAHATARNRCMTLDGGELVRRFLLHLLPKGLMRVRHDGFLANRCRRTRLTQIRAALVAKTAAGYTYRVAYEDFVRASQAEVARVLAFLGIEASALQRREAVAGVSSGSIGKGRAVFDGHAINRLEPLVHETLARYGYA